MLKEGLKLENGKEKMDKIDIQLKSMLMNSLFFQQKRMQLLMLR